MPVSDIAKMGGIGENVKVFTHFHVSENAVGLFGFLTNEQIDYFNKLIAISGIGPKAAVSILGTLSVQDLAFAIIAEDTKAISRAPGVGPKAAQRIILELKGKIDTQEAVGAPMSMQSAPKTALRADTEAVNALIALGASPSEAQKTVMQISKDGALTVVCVSGGYPEEYRKGIEMGGSKYLFENNPDSKIKVFHSGTAMKDGKLVTAGGRVLAVTVNGNGIEQQRDVIYAELAKIEYEGKYCRRDVGLDLLNYKA
jgi:Holliday junction DNA helicase RuvA